MREEPHKKTFLGILEYFVTKAPAQERAPLISRFRSLHSGAATVLVDEIDARLRTVSMVARETWSPTYFPVSMLVMVFR